MSPCPAQKRKDTTEEMAEDALIEARTRFIHNSAIGVYQCEDCGQWHLTSQGVLNPRLKKLLKDGTIKRDRDALNWEMKLKRS